MDRQDGVPRIVFVVEQGPKLGLLKVGLQPQHGGVDVGLDAFSFGGELGQDLEFLLVAEDALEELKLLLQQPFFLLQGLGGLVILPHLGRGEPGVGRLEIGFLVIEVKENLGPLRLGRRGRRGGF